MYTHAAPSATAAVIDEIFQEGSEDMLGDIDATGDAHVEWWYHIFLRHEFSSGSVAALTACVQRVGAPLIIFGESANFSHQNLVPLNWHLLKPHDEHSGVRIIFVIAWLSPTLCAIERCLNSGIELVTADLRHHNVFKNRFATISSTECYNV